MRNICNLILLMVTTLAFISCDKKAQEPLLKPLEVSEISGERLWARISQEADFRDYGPFPDHEGLRPGQSPHGLWHQVYVNRVLLEALPIQDRIAPVGSILVKENYTSARELDKYTVMAKVEGYDPEHNDWFFAAIAPDGKILAEGSPQGCISCHGGNKQNDFVVLKRLDIP